MMIDPADIERSLQPLLPGALPAHIVALARLLLDAANGTLAQDALPQRLAAEPAIVPLLQQLAGRQLTLDDATLSIQQDRQAERAAGTGAPVHLSIVPGRVGERAIDQRQGVFISGGTVNGFVVGVNEGTINYTAVTV